MAMVQSATGCGESTARGGEGCGKGETGSRAGSDGMETGHLVGGRDVAGFIGVAEHSVDDVAERHCGVLVGVLI